MIRKRKAAQRTIERVVATYKGRVDELARQVDDEDLAARARAAPRIKDTALRAVDGVWNDSPFGDAPTLYFHRAELNELVDEFDSTVFMPYLLQRLRITFEDFILAAADEHGTAEEREVTRKKMAARVEGRIAAAEQEGGVSSELPDLYRLRDQLKSGPLLESDAELLPLSKSMPGGHGRARVYDTAIQISTPGNQHKFEWEKVDWFQSRDGIAGPEILIQFKVGAGTGGYMLLVYEDLRAWQKQLERRNIPKKNR